MNAPTVVLRYNEELAVKAGGGDFLSDGGAYVVYITEAKYITAKTGSSGLEFSVTTKEGLKANYISVYYAKKSDISGQPGEAIKGGLSCLNAMMGILRAAQMTAVKRGDSFFCPEFEGKTIGLFLQKKLMSKGDGSDSYGFEIKVPFNPIDKKTMREISNNQPAQTIDRMTAGYKDQDDRKSQTHSVSGNQSVGAQTGGFYNDDPGF